jgi:hypothetical protein
VYKPVVLFNFEHFDCIVDFLFGASEETSERVNEFVIYGACGQVVALIFHGSGLYPFIFCHDVLLDRV